MSVSRFSRLVIVAAVLWVGIGMVAVAQEGAVAKPADGEDPALYAHIEYLVKMLDSKNKIIRRSVYQGLAAIGKPALPALEAAAAKGRGPRSGQARRIVKTIQNRLAKRAAKGTSETGESRRPPRGRRGGLTEAALAKVLGEIGSDPSLAGEIKVAMDEQRKGLRELKKAEEGTDPALLKKKRRALTRAFREKLNDLLGPDQARAFRKALGNRRKAKAPGDADRKKKKNRFDRSAGDAVPQRAR